MAHKIMVVLDGPTPELADQAADKLAQSLSAQSFVIESVAQPGGGPFFERNALLFLEEQDVATITSGLGQSAPLLRILASDPSLRGIAGVLTFVATGVQKRRLNSAILPTRLRLVRIRCQRFWQEARLASLGGS
jgi:uncharacterized protein